MEWVPIFYFRLFVKLGGGSIFQKACFLEIKEYALNTSLKKRVFPIEIVKIDLGMFFSYLFDNCCHIISLFYLIYRIFNFWYIFLYIRIEAARRGCDMEFRRSSKFWKRFFHHKFEISWIWADTLSIHTNFFMRMRWNGWLYFVFR